MQHLLRSKTFNESSGRVPAFYLDVVSLNGTPTKCPVSKSPVLKRPKRPISKRLVFKTSCFKTSLLVNITKRLGSKMSNILLKRTKKLPRNKEQILY